MVSKTKLGKYMACVEKELEGNIGALNLFDEFKEATEDMLCEGKPSPALIYENGEWFVQEGNDPAITAWNIYEKVTREDDLEGLENGLMTPKQFAEWFLLE